jgi:hypothetical protein
VYRGVGLNKAAYSEKLRGSPKKQQVEEASDFFLEVYGAKHPQACACLYKGQDKLLTFYDFPAEH